MNSTTDLVALEATLQSQLAANAPAGIPLEKRHPFPPPLGAWLVIGKPANLRGSMVKHGVTPIGLLIWWLDGTSYAHIADWSDDQLQAEAKGWPADARKTAATESARFRSLFEIRGKVKPETQWAARLFGAWRALSRMHPEKMPLSELAWSQLAIQIKGERDPWWLVSDNYKANKLPKDAMRWTASEAAKVLTGESSDIPVLLEVKSVFPKAKIEDVVPNGI